MNYLDDLSMADLHGLLAEVEGKKPTLRVVVGVNYKQGVSPTEIARWYDLSRTTVYNWLDRLERVTSDPRSSVLLDADRPGRPSKLSTEQRDTLVRTVASTPRDAGIDADEWTPRVLQQYIDDTFGVRFTRRHSRTLLDELR